MEITCHGQNVAMLVSAAHQATFDIPWTDPENFSQSGPGMFFLFFFFVGLFGFFKGGGGSHQLISQRVVRNISTPPL